MRLRVRWPDGLRLTVEVRHSAFLGGLWGHDGWVCGRTIYVKRREVSEAFLRHELTHVRQIHDMGAATFYWRYLMSEKFRQEVESDAKTAAERGSVPTWVIG